MGDLMKNTHTAVKSSKRGFSFLLVILFAVSLFPQHASAKAFDDIEAFKNSALDGIENLAIKTGIPDAKKKMWDKFGFLLKPFFKSRYTLTSNVFKEPNTGGDRTDNVWEFTPGFQWLAKLPSKLGVVGGAYEATFRYFTQFSEQNASDQKFLVYSNLFPTENTYVRISEKLDAQEPAAGNSAQEPVDYRDNTVNFVTGYNQDEWTFEFGYENFDRNFEQDIANRYDYNENKFDPRIYRKINESFRAFTGFRLGLVNFIEDQSRDTTYFEIPFGIEGKLPYDVNLIASAGPHRRNLGDSTRNDVTTFVTNISLQKLFNHERTDVEMGFLRRPVESAFSTATTYDEKLLYASLKHLLTPYLRGRTNIYLGNRDFYEPVFTGTRFVVGNAIFVSPANQVKRNDNVIGFGFGFDYNVRKWLILHMDYQYSRRNSNISTLDYTENAFSLGSTMPF